MRVNANLTDVLLRPIGRGLGPGHGLRFPNICLRIRVIQPAQTLGTRLDSAAIFSEYLACEVAREA